MRPKSLILLGLALGCGLVASLGINQVMSQGSPVAAPGDDKEAIFVALKDVNINDPITADLVKLEQWPKDRVPADALRKLEELDQRRARQRIYKGEPLVQRKLSEKGEGGYRPTDHIPAGYRVTAVKVDASATGGYLVKPGDRVDLVLHVVKNPSRGIGETATKTFLQDVKVFAVNSTIAEEEDADAISAKTVSLLLKPDEIEKVTLASHLGSITLSLRPPQDDEQVVGNGTSTAELFESDGDSSTRVDEAASLAAELEARRRAREQAQEASGNPFAAILTQLAASGQQARLQRELEASTPHRMQVLTGRGEVQLYDIAKDGSQPPRQVTGEPEEKTQPFIPSWRLDENDDNDDK